MKNLKNLLLMGLFSFALLAACETDPNTDPGNDDGGVVPPPVEQDATIVLKKKVVDVAVSGGTYLLEYEIENAHQGEKISATAAEDWVSDFDSSISGALSFKVAANTGDVEREALVTVSYRYAPDVTFTVKQGAKTGASFSVEKVGNGNEYFSFTVNVFPENKQLPYIVMSASPSYIEEWGLESDEALYQDDYLYFEYLGKFHGMTPVEVMRERAKLGDVRNLTVGQGTPGETYVFYCYYFDYDSGALISDIGRFDITVDHPALKDVSDSYYTFNHTIDGPRVHTEVVASSDKDYYFDVMSAAELQFAESKGFTKEEYIKQWWAGIVSKLHHAEGFSTYDIVAQNTCKGTNSDGSSRNQWSYDLLAETEYYLFAFDLDENALCVTTPKYVKFKTGSVEPSDNVLTIDVTDVTAYRATVNISATHSEYTDAYVTDIATAEDWASFGRNDKERMNYIKNHYALEYMWGSKSISYSNIKPGTEYVAYAFGLYGGVVTTALYTQTFQTKSDAPGEVDITFKELGYYDPTDIATISGLEFFGSDYYSGWAIVPLEVQFSKKNHGDWFYENYDWTGRYESEYYNDEQYLSGLIWQMEQHGSYPSTHSYAMVRFDGLGIIVAVVIDVNGQYSKLYKREYRATYDGVGDPQVFAEWYDNWQNGGNAGLSSLVVKEAPAAEAKANVIEVDKSISNLKAVPSVVKASERTFEVKAGRPAADVLTAAHTR